MNLPPLPDIGEMRVIIGEGIADDGGEGVGGLHGFIVRPIADERSALTIEIDKAG